MMYKLIFNYVMRNGLERFQLQADSACRRDLIKPLNAIVTPDCKFQKRLKWVSFLIQIHNLFLAEKIYISVFHANTMIKLTL